MLVILFLFAFVLVVTTLVNLRVNAKVTRYFHRVTTWLAAGLIAAAMFFAGLSIHLSLLVLAFSGGILTLFVSLVTSHDEQHLHF